MYECMHVCIYVYIYIYIYIYIYVCMHACMYVCIYARFVCTYARMYVRMNVYVFRKKNRTDIVINSNTLSEPSSTRQAGNSIRLLALNKIVNEISSN